MPKGRIMKLILDFVPCLVKIKSFKKWIAWPLFTQPLLLLVSDVLFMSDLFFYRRFATTYKFYTYNLQFIYMCMHLLYKKNNVKQCVKK